MAESYVCVEIDSNKTISVLDKLPNGQTLDNYSKFDDVVNDNNIQKSKYIAIKIMKGQCSQPNNCFQFAGIEYEMMLDNLPNDISALKPIDDAFLSSKTSAANTNVASNPSANTNVVSSNVVSSNVVSNGGRRGVPNVGNSCWANGVYQMLYDAEDFRNSIIDGTWQEDFFTTNSDNLTGSLHELTSEEKARKAVLEQQVNLTEDEQKEHDKLNLKQDTSNWSWVSKNMTPEEYKDIFGSLLQKIFKYIRGDDIKITYETSLIPVLLFPDNNNRQQDSREFIQQLRTKTDEGLSADSKNLLNIDTYFGFQQQDGKRYYIDNDNGEDTKIQLSDPIKTPTTMIELPLGKNETNVQDLANLYARGTVDDFDVEGIKDEEWKKIVGLNPGSEDEMNGIKARGKVPVYFNTNQEYSDFSKYLLVTLTREAMNGGKREKNTTKVAFDDKLEIKGNNFTLVGVVVHAGTGTDSGHYVYESIIGNQEYNDSANNELYSSYKKDYVEKNWTILLFKNDTATSQAENVEGNEGKEGKEGKGGDASFGGKSLKAPKKKNKRTKRKYYVYNK